MTLARRSLLTHDHVIDVPRLDRVEDELCRRADLGAALDLGARFVDAPFRVRGDLIRTAGKIRTV